MVESRPNFQKQKKVPWENIFLQPCANLWLKIQNTKAVNKFDI